MVWASTMAVAALAAAVLACGTPAGEQDRLVILVRHAEKAAEPARDPPLTDAGLERAAALASSVAHARIGAVIVTPFLRTAETAQPLAASAGLTPIVIDVAGGSHVEEVARAVRARPPGEAVLVVGHSNTIPAIIAALGGPRLADLCDDEYDSLFVLTLSGDRAPHLVRTTYGASDGVEGETCSEASAR